MTGIGQLLAEMSLGGVLLLQSTACLAGGLAAGYLFRPRAARAHQILLISMLAAVLMPGAYLVVKHLDLGALATTTTAPTTGPALSVDPAPALPPSPDVAERPVVATTYEAPLVSIPGPAAPQTIDARRPAQVPWRSLFYLGWGLAAAGLLTHLVLRFALGLRLLRRAEPVESTRIDRAAETAQARLGIETPVQVRSSEKVRSPIIWCWTSLPILLVQADAERREDETDWAGILCHELAHWKRRDHVSGLWAELLTVALPWHPLVWWARQRLLTLSEQVCDDWVVADSGTGLNYAESLLDLSPGNQLAFLPTVVGKEGAMKKRIHRILKDRCGDPRVGVRWALAIGALAVLTTMAVAFAQRRTPEPVGALSFEQHEPGSLQERQKLLRTGRKNVLNRLLEQLTTQARETEAFLHERGDSLGADGPILRAELETLCQQIELIKQQLGELEQDRSPAQVIDELMRQAEKLERHRDELARMADFRQRELATLDDRNSEEAYHLRMELREIYENIDRLDAEGARIRDQLAGMERHAGATTGRGHRESEREEAEPREARPAAQEMRELTGHLRDLQVLAEQTERELAEWGDSDADEARQLRAKLEQTHDKMRDVEAELAQMRRSTTPAAEERIDRRPERSPQENEDLDQRLRELTERIPEIQRQLRRREHRGQGDSPEARELRAALETMNAERQEIRTLLRTKRQSRGEPRPEAHRETPRTPTRDELMEEIRRLEEMLEDVKDPDGRLGQRIRNALRSYHARLEALDAESQAPARPPESRRPAAALQDQVEDLRGKIDGMHEEMTQMRKMLKQLLERSRADANET